MLSEHSGSPLPVPSPVPSAMFGHLSRTCPVPDLNLPRITAGYDVWPLRVCVR
ncbi:hypothetical protein ABZX62_05265 [Streptomyces flavidovirens]|uniref:hypothetical protein n=1 Tax=Streptomyces flavidovirens TaxID=67298 RepID=UPI0033AD436B